MHSSSPSWRGSAVIGCLPATPTSLGSVRMQIHPCVWACQMSPGLLVFSVNNLQFIMHFSIIFNQRCYYSIIINCETLCLLVNHSPSRFTSRSRFLPYTQVTHSVFAFFPIMYTRLLTVLLLTSVTS